MAPNPGTTSRCIETRGPQSGAPLESCIAGLFTPGRLLDYVRHCVTFEEDERSGAIIKKGAAYHQFRAVREARESVKAALKAPGG